MSHRFFVTVPPSSNCVVLAGPEAHHLRDVMRAKVGDAVTLFDGEGNEAIARIERISGESVELAVIEWRLADKELPIELTMAVALPKGDRQRWLVEKLVELGVARLVPLITARGVAQPTASAIERLRRWVVEASKQSGRARLMEIVPGQNLSELVGQRDAGALCVIAHPGGKAVRDIWPAGAVDTKRRAIVAVGPEGGFTDEEVATPTSSGWQTIDLGPRILRIETAALAIASWISLATAGAQSSQP